VWACGRVGVIDMLNQNIKRMTLLVAAKHDMAAPRDVTHIGRRLVLIRNNMRR
jgi:hypothetical protein